MTQEVQESTSYNEDPEVLKTKITELKQIAATLIAELAYNKEAKLHGNLLMGEGSSAIPVMQLETVKVLIDLYTNLCRSWLSDSERQELSAKINENEHIFQKWSALAGDNQDNKREQSTQVQPQWDKISALCLSNQEFAEYQENQREMRKLAIASPNLEAEAKNQVKEMRIVGNLKEEESEFDPMKNRQRALIKKRQSLTDYTYRRFWKIADDKNIPFGRSMFFSQAFTTAPERSQPEAELTDVVDGKNSTVFSMLSTSSSSKTNSRKRKQAVSHQTLGEGDSSSNKTGPTST